MAPVVKAFSLLAVWCSSFALGRITQVSQDNCNVFVPSLGDNPIFVAGISSTVTWDISDVPEDACTISSFEFDSIHSVIISTLATSIDPYAGTLTFIIPSVSSGAYWLAFNAEDGRHATLVSIR